MREREKRIGALEHAVIREAGLPPLHLAAGAEAPAREDIRALARQCLDDMKALDLVEIDLVGRTSIADAMMIASGTSARHVGSIAERLTGQLKDSGFGRVRSSSRVSGSNTISVVWSIRTQTR